MELTVILGLLMAGADFLLDGYAKKNEDKRKEIELARNLLRQFGDRLPQYVEYISKFGNKELALDDMEKMSMEEIDRRIAEEYQDTPPPE